jgi:arylsulfatase A-like enzyme
MHLNIRNLLIMLINLMFCFTNLQAQEARPNILWIVAEDLSPFFGCYGDNVNAHQTPMIDALAKEGLIYSKAYATAPVCSASRSAFITGVMQTSTGTHQHRSSRFENGKLVPEDLRIHLPNHIETIPEMLKKSGYFTFNNGKDDYNFHYDRRKLYDVGTKADYVEGMNGWQGNRPKHWKSFTKDVWSSEERRGRPWFGQIQIDGGKGDKRYLSKQKYVDPTTVALPPYFPDSPALRKAWAIHFSNARGSDIRVGEILRQLKQDGELENTVIFFFSDHGHNTSLRHKQFCYEGGLRVPLILTGKPISQKGVVDKLVTLLDVSATTLALAGVEVPLHIDGHDLLSHKFPDRDHIVAARDRCDYTIDKIRSTRCKKFRYIRNYHPDRSMLQAGYRDNKGPTQELKKHREAGLLTPYQEEFWFGVRPSEELYHLKNDPHQTNNLARDIDYRKTLIRHRSYMDNWIDKTNDQGQYHENPRQLKATYDLWKDLPIFKRAKTNPEYKRFKSDEKN